MPLTSTNDCQDGYDAPDITDLPADGWIDVSGNEELIVHAKWATSGAGAIGALSLYGTNFDDKSAAQQISRTLFFGDHPGSVASGSVIDVFRALPKWVCWRAENVSGTGSTSAAFVWR